MKVNAINKLLNEKKFDEAKKQALSNISKNTINLPIVSLYIQKLYEMNYFQSKELDRYKTGLRFYSSEQINAHVLLLKKIISDSQEEINRKISRCINGI